MFKTQVYIAKMDCPSEIKLIETAMENLDSSIKIEFDLSTRLVSFYHKLDEKLILNQLKNIDLPGKLSSHQEIENKDIPEIQESVETKTLVYLLSINLLMFVTEISIGIYSSSTGLIADGLDMLADALVYGLSLYAVGKALKMKQRASYFSGIIQISLGGLCILEVVRNLYYGSEPISFYMISVSIFALIANLACLTLIHKHRNGEVHMKASWIFSANDVIVNTGVIISGVLVYYFNTNIPDLLIGFLVSLIVIRGGVVILKLTKPTTSHTH